MSNKAKAVGAVAGAVMKVLSTVVNPVPDLIKQAGDVARYSQTEQRSRANYGMRIERDRKRGK